MEVAADPEDYTVAEDRLLTGEQCCTVVAAADIAGVEEDKMRRTVGVVARRSCAVAQARIAASVTALEVMDGLYS